MKKRKKYPGGFFVVVVGVTQFTCCAIMNAFCRGENRGSYMAELCTYRHGRRGRSKTK